jgi:hypothetical protein
MLISTKHKGLVIGGGILKMDFLNYENKNFDEKNRVMDEQRLKCSPIVFYSQDILLRYNWVYNQSPDLSIDALLGKRDDEIYSSR